MEIRRKLTWIFGNARGELRSGWKLAAGIFVYALAFYAVLWGMGAVFGALFDGWGLTTSNLHLAPVWAQAVVAGHTDAVYAIAYILSGIAAGAVAGRGSWAGKSSCRMCGTGAALGAGAGIGLAVLALVVDSMRLEWPLNEPAFGWRHISALIVLVLASMSGEILTKRVIFDAMRTRFGRVAGYAAAAAAALILSGCWQSPFGIVSALMMAITGCALYERGGLLASTSMQAGWTAATAWLMAWPGASVPVYRMYHVSEAWLTGGNAGAMCGLGSVIVWGIVAAVLLRAELRRLMEKIMERGTKDGKDQNCNRGSGLERRRLLRQGAAGDAGSRRGRGAR